MGEHATESNSLSGKSLPHVNELSLSLQANKFCHVPLQLRLNSFSFCVNEMLRQIYALAVFPLLVFFPWKTMAAFWFLFLSPCACDGRDSSFESNPTWLSFSSDDIRVYSKGWGFGVCTSDFLAKPSNPGDGVRRITVWASFVEVVTVSLWDLNLV